MAKTLKFRDQFGGNVNAKDGSTYTIPFGGELVTPHTGDPIDLADGEEARLKALGAFDAPDPAENEKLLRMVKGIANQPSPELAHGTAPEGEEVTTPGIDVPDEAPADEADEKPARSRRS